MLIGKEVVSQPLLVLMEIAEMKGLATGGD